MATAGAPKGGGAVSSWGVLGGHRGAGGVRPAPTLAPRRCGRTSCRYLLGSDAPCLGSRARRARRRRRRQHMQAKAVLEVGTGLIQPNLHPPQPPSTHQPALTPHWFAGTSPARTHSPRPQAPISQRTGVPAPWAPQPGAGPADPAGSPGLGWLPWVPWGARRGHRQGTHCRATLAPRCSLSSVIPMNFPAPVTVPMETAAVIP